MIIPTTECSGCGETATEMYTENPRPGVFHSVYECRCGAVTERRSDVSTFSGMFVNRNR